MTNSFELLKNLIEKPEQSNENMVSKELTKLMFGLKREVDGGREYNAYDVAEILKSCILIGSTESDLVEAIESWAEVLEVAQNTKQSIESCLDERIVNSPNQEMRNFFKDIKAEPQLYNWIKTSSV